MIAKSLHLLTKLIKTTLVELMKRARNSQRNPVKTPSHLNRIDCSKQSMMRCSRLFRRSMTSSRRSLLRLCNRFALSKKKSSKSNRTTNFISVNCSRISISWKGKSRLRRASIRTWSNVIKKTSCLIVTLKPTLGNFKVTCKRWVKSTRSKRTLQNRFKASKKALKWAKSSSWNSTHWFRPKKRGLSARSSRMTCSWKSRVRRLKKQTSGLPTESRRVESSMSNCYSALICSNSASLSLSQREMSLKKTCAKWRLVTKMPSSCFKIRQKISRD